MDVEQAKNDLLETMASIDKDKLSLYDLKLYAETLRIVSETQSKGYMEYLAGLATSGFGSTYNPATISDMKGGAA